MAVDVLRSLSIPARQIHTGEKKMETLRTEELFEIEGGFWETVGGLLYAFVVALAF